MEIEKASELFGVSGKNVEHFSITTPAENLVNGWICKSRGSNMGSLIIDTVNGIETWQFARGMPKIQYLDKRDDPSMPHILNKEDGTNIVHYPLIVDGEVMETLFKTRMMPNCNENWLVKIYEVITPEYYKAVEKEKLSFSYELYGVHNKHEVKYEFLDVPELNLNLLTTLGQGKSLPYKETVALAEKYNIPMVIRDFDISIDDEQLWADPRNEFCDIYYEYLPNVEPHGGDLESLYHDIESFFEKMNMNFQDKHIGGIITEGSVWHYGEDENHMKKCKAISVREGHIRKACGIPHHDIRKAIVKTDENSENGLDDVSIEYIINNVNDELLEEYDSQMVYDKKTEDKIKSVLAKYLRKIEIDDNMAAIIEKIHEEINEDASPADKMRVFAQLFPDMRKQSRTVYQALVSM